MKLRFILMVIVLLSLILSACTKEEIVENPVQIANPASVFCEENGGTLDIRETSEGQVGMCVLPTGEECEEWAYFRGECPSTDEKIYCTAEQKESEFCTMEYLPVCGYTSNDLEIDTFGNKCVACSVPDVTYYIEGECN